jgi:hypothetical protein
VRPLPRVVKRRYIPPSAAPRHLSLELDLTSPSSARCAACRASSARARGRDCQPCYTS